MKFMMDKPQSEFCHPTVCLVVLDDESVYKMYKQVFGEYQIPSQVVTCRLGKKFDLSKASNILKQINSKTGGNLYHMVFPNKLEQMRTMLIGIDVCHAGSHSIVGFAASNNREMS